MTFVGSTSTATPMAVVSTKVVIVVFTVSNWSR
jgi:hypothetical protein